MNDNIKFKETELAELKEKYGLAKKSYNERKTLPLSKSELYERAALVADLAFMLSKKDKELGAEYEKDYEKITGYLQNEFSSARIAAPKVDLENDIVGLHEVKEELAIISHLIKHPELSKGYGMSNKFGILLWGPTGCAKTMIIEALSNRLCLPLFVIKLEQVKQPYVGQAEETIHRMFTEINNTAFGCIVAFDEVDAIFGARTNDSQSHEISRVNQLLQEIDGIGRQGANRILVGTTNRPEALDKAALRYGRFSHAIYVGLPNREAREELLRHEFDGMIDGNATQILEMLTDKTDGYTGSDIKQIKFHAVKHHVSNKLKVDEKEFSPVLTNEDFDFALSKCQRSVSPETILKYELLKKNLFEGK